MGGLPCAKEIICASEAAAKAQSISDYFEFFEGRARELFDNPQDGEPEIIIDQAEQVITHLNSALDILTAE